MKRATAVGMGIAGFVVLVGGLVLVARRGDDVRPPARASLAASTSAPPSSATIPPELLPMSAPSAIHHVLSTGQSLSVGWVGHPPLSTRQPYGNLMFANGVVPGGSDLSSFAPLVEGPDVETMSSGMANLVTRMARDLGAPGAIRHDVLVSGHGINGTPYLGLKKGTTAFANGMAQVRAALAIAKGSGKSYVVRAVTNVHGEADHTSGNRAYLRDLFEWQSDYEKDVSTLTGQTTPVPMFHTQMSSFSIFGSKTSEIPQAQLQAHVESHGKIVLVGPKYHLAYATDGLHLTNQGYRHMGEDYAKVYRRVVLEGKPWEPLRPIAVTRAGNVITVKFVVPVPPIVLDEERVTNPDRFGFEYADDGSSTSIASVRVTGPDTIAITLSVEPTRANKRLRYAYTGTPNAGAGPKTGPRGNVRDSDATVSEHGYPLYNWCVHFDEAVP